MSITEVLAGVLAEHEDCGLNAGQDLGSAATGQDVWTCGIVLPFNEHLEAAERGHLAAALAIALRQYAQQAETVDRAARAHYEAWSFNTADKHGVRDVQGHNALMTRAVLAAFTEAAS